MGRGQRSSRTLFLVDGTSQLYRAYFALPPLTNAEGLPTHAVYGFTNMLRKLLKEERPPHLAVAFDKSGPVFRHDAYAEYKANRPPTPEDLKVQMPYARQVCELLGVPVLEQAGFEADDLIATLARQARDRGFEVVVVASDKDLLQLVEDGVTLLNPAKNVELDADGVTASFGVEPAHVADVLGLMGDAVDNVPGVPGVGQKSALAAVASYGSMEHVIERANRFASAWRLRDDAVAAIEALAATEHVDAAAVERVGTPIVEVGEALERLKEIERDEVFADRLAGALATLGDADVAGLEGQPGKKAAKQLAAAKRELKGLDRGSSKRVWLSISEHAEQARLSRQLVTLSTDAPVELDTDGLTPTGADVEGARALFQSLGFRIGVEELAPFRADRPDAGVSSPRALEIHRDPGGIEGVLAACREAGRMSLCVVTGDGPPLEAPLEGIALAASPDVVAWLAWDSLDDDARSGLAAALSDASIVKSAHDLKAIDHVLVRHGLPVAGWTFDVRVAAFLLNAGRSGYELPALAAEFLGQHLPAATEALAGEPDPASTPARYAVWTADLTDRLRDRLQQAELLRLYETIDGPLLPLLARMERNGIAIDTELLGRMSAELEGALATLETAIHELAGGAFNVDSPKQLREVLFERLGLKSRRKTAKSRAASTDAQTLEELADQHAIAGRVLEYRELAKLKSTYVDALPRLVNPRTERIHTRYDPAGAATGRLSSSDPNLQNIPVRTEAGRRVRAAFVPAADHVFLASDYSQIELRVLAHLCDDPGLGEAFRNGEDIHRHTAARIFEVAPDLVSDGMRRRAKAINFGILYGMSETRLAREQGIPRKDARRFIQAYFARFSRVGEYIERTREQARRDAAVRTLFGRVRYFPQLHRQTNRALLEQALRGAVNTTIQGTAADLMKMAMLAVDRALAAAGRPARILLQVHDELLLEVPPGALEPVRQLVREAMETVYPLAVPLVVDQKTGHNWLEMS